ncbi:MAG TPA: hypothetical protein P5081_07630 [Phycisphaerae bacterium]|nr:hypothetical protein [Phycisphaerae bacterium]HRW52742.1 hypothetical protein [Phycisphaerae bacterium]
MTDDRRPVPASQETQGAPTLHHEESPTAIREVGLRPLIAELAALASRDFQAVSEIQRKLLDVLLATSDYCRRSRMDEWEVDAFRKRFPDWTGFSSKLADEMVIEPGSADEILEAILEMGRGQLYSQFDRGLANSDYRRIQASWRSLVGRAPEDANIVGWEIGDSTTGLFRRVIRWTYLWLSEPWSRQRRH